MTFLFLMFITLGNANLFAENQNISQIPTVILLSFDGARPDYFTKKTAPNITQFMKKGWKGELTSIFPSETFPNHTAIITGCTAEEHGIVSNQFIDATRGSFAYDMDPSWIQCEPIWATAQKHGLKTAVTYWPLHGKGSWKGMKPTYQNAVVTTDIREIIKFDDEAKFQQMLQWLDLPAEQRPHLIFSWFAEIDTVGQAFGPQSHEVQKVIKKYDSLFGNFLTALQKKPDADRINILIVSGHGMEEMHYSMSLPYLGEELRKQGMDNIIIKASGTNAKVHVKNSAEKRKALTLLQAMAKEKGAFQVYDVQELPDAWHSTHKRSGDLLLIGKNKFFFLEKASTTEFLTDVREQHIGKHGYPPEDKSMRAVFFAHGPHFPQQSGIRQLHITDIAPAIIKILNLSPQPIDIAADTVLSSR